jgi:hypothetical protein
MNAQAQELSGELATELEANDREVLPKLIRELREVRDQANDLKTRGDRLRDLVRGLLEDAGGEYVDEVSGLRAWIEVQPRYEFDPTRMHKLVEEHLLTESEFAECLKTTVDKAVVSEWLGKGILTDRQLNRVGAKVGTAIVRTVQIKSIAPLRVRR